MEASILKGFIYTKESMTSKIQRNYSFIKSFPNNI